MTEKDTIIRLKDDEGNEYILYPATKAENIIGLKTVAISGSYNDLDNQPVNATTSKSGFMSNTDKSKLDGIAAGANKTTVDTALSSTSTNPVQNKVVQDALDKKANTADLPNIKKHPSRQGIFDEYIPTDYVNENDDYYQAGCGILMGRVLMALRNNDYSDNPENIIALGDDHTNAGGCNCILIGTGLTSNTNHIAIGTYPTSTDAYILIGKGVSDSNRSNAFRVSRTGQGYFATSVSGTGADYAEQWEWADGNPNSEDRVGFFVAFQGNKIRLANETDNLRKVGIVSARPAVIGDDYDDEWQGKYLTDIFGRYLTETIEEDGKTREVFILNPDYDPEQEYVPREQRPEFDKVGTHGKLVVIDDGTCEVDGFCRPTSGGIATASEDGFYVMERIDDTHIRVYLR